MEEVIKLQVTNLVQRNMGDFAKSNSATEKEIDCKVYQHPNFVRSTYSTMYTTLNIDSQLAMILCCMLSLQSSVCSVWSAASLIFRVEAYMRSI